MQIDEGNESSDEEYVTSEESDDSDSLISLNDDGLTADEDTSLEDAENAIDDNAVAPDCGPLHSSPRSFLFTEIEEFSIQYNPHTLTIAMELYHLFLSSEIVSLIVTGMDNRA